MDAFIKELVRECGRGEDRVWFVMAKENATAGWAAAHAEAVNVGEKSVRTMLSGVGGMRRIGARDLG